MKSELDMFKQHANDSFNFKGRNIFTLENAIKFIDDCYENNFSISHIDCFVRQSEDLIEQRGDFLNLYYPLSFESWNKEKLLKRNKSLDFINDPNNKKMLFCFMLFSENEWLILIKELELINKFDGKKFEVGNEIIFPLNDAINFTEFCADNDFAILGIDGFILENKRFKLSLDYILDLSEKFMYLSFEEDKEECKLIALKFLEWVNDKDLFFSFVIISENEWKERRESGT